jgi:hypothetical protein
LRIGDAASGAKGAQELFTLAANTAEHAEFLKNHGPGNNGEKQEKRENPAGNPAGLGKKAFQVNQQKCV